MSGRRSSCSTHDDKFGPAVLTGALATDAFYVGAARLQAKPGASKTRLLREAGVPGDQHRQDRGPVRPRLGAGSPAETALSMLAEIVAVRMGRSGGPLRAASQRIHAEPLAAKK